MDESNEYFICECKSLVHVSQWESHAQTHLPGIRSRSPDGSDSLCEDNQSGTNILDSPAKEIQSMDLTEQFVDCIRIREPLWNSKLPLSKRSRPLRDKLWMEVFEELNGAIPLNKLETKWKGLKDTYIKYKNLYTPSGSGTDSKKKKWKHFSLLSFLNDSLQTRNTSNFNNVNHKLSRSPISPLEPSPSTSSTITETVINPSKKCKKSDKFEDELLTILQKPATQQYTVSSAMQTVHEVLKKLPPRIRMQAEVKFITEAYNLYNECFPE